MSSSVVVSRIERKPNYKSGDVYGYFTLTGKSYTIMSGGRMRRFLECLCECGTIVYRDSSNVRRNLTKSCGCMDKGSTTHGLSRTPIYITWISMKSRCFNTKSVQYGDYGGRGISICEEWQIDFKSFYDWSISNGWKEGLTIEREDVNGNYEPANCKWATQFEQTRNKRNSHLVTAFGETKNLADWVLDARCLVSSGELHRRLLIMTPEAALSTKPKSSNQWRQY